MMAAVCSACVRAGGGFVCACAHIPTYMWPLLAWCVRACGRARRVQWRIPYALQDISNAALCCAVLGSSDGKPGLANVSSAATLL